MRIAEYKQIDTEIIERECFRHVLDEDGNETTETESYIERIEKPIMAMVYRDATEEEETEILRQQIEAESHRYDGMSYSDIVETLIREKYSVSDELAILRQRDSKADEFEAYNLFAEECKTRAKELIK